MLKIYRITFLDSKGYRWSEFNITGKNCKDAMNKAIIYRRKQGDTYYNRIQDIKEVVFVCETN